MASQNIQVFVRCRPQNKDDKRSVVQVIPELQQIQIFDKHGSAPNDTKDFHFDQVFGPDAPQIDIYRTVVGPLIDQVLLGFNCTVLAYGPTGTGKTYTMEGGRIDEEMSWEEDPCCGVIPRAISQLFNTLKMRKNEFTVRVSFLELYNEEAYDLLSHPNDTSKLKIFDDASRKGSVIVGNLQDVLVQTKAEVYDILSRGAAKRQTAATLINACSSRSHTVFSITIQIDDKIGKLNLVDMAGSENIGRSGAQDKRAREAGNINQSLLTLGRVIQALVENRPHIPYRESKLTRLLQDSLGGKTKTSIIATISPSLNDIEDTLSTLEYASRARSIVNRPESNQQIPTRKQLDDRELQEIYERHSIELSELEFRVRNEVAIEFRREIEKMKESYASSHLEAKEDYEKDLKKLRAEIETIKESYASSHLEAKEDYENELKKLRAEIETIKESSACSHSEAKEDYEKELKKLRAEIKTIKESSAIELKKNKAESDKYKAEMVEYKAEMEKKEAELEKKEAELEKKEAELEKNRAEMEKNRAEMEKNKAENERLKREFKVTLELADYRADLLDAAEAKLKVSELENRRLQIEIAESKAPDEIKRAPKIRKVPVLEESGEYANLTFDGGDELAQVSAKKSRKTVVAGARKRAINENITLSGKKRKLSNQQLEEPELSPIAKPVRVTRSRTTKRKLDF